MRTPSLFLLLLTTLLWPLFGCASAPTEPSSQVALQQEARVVICVRHAEKQSGEDPALTAEGLERAQALARLLGAGDVTHLFASQYRRTQQTLEPLAARTDLTVETYDAGQPADLLARLDALAPGSVAVVAGHSNTVPALVRSLGGNLRDTTDSAYGEVVAGNAHDRALMVIRSANSPAPTVVELHYGLDG